MRASLLLVVFVLGGCAHRAKDETGAAPVQDRPAGVPATPVLAPSPAAPLSPTWREPEVHRAPGPAALSGWAPGTVLACVVMPDGTLSPTPGATAVVRVEEPTTRPIVAESDTRIAVATTDAATPTSTYGATHGDVAFVPPAEVIPPQLPAPNTPTMPTAAP